MKLKRTYKYRLYPNKKQENILVDTLDVCRYLYNCALQERRDAYSKNKVSLNYNHQQNELPECKVQNPELDTVYAQVLQNVLRRLDKSFQSFFRRIKAKQKAGYPRFKGIDRYDSFTFTQSGFKIQDKKLALSKIGAIKINLSRPIEGKTKQLTIIKTELHLYERIYNCKECNLIMDRDVNAAKNILQIGRGKPEFKLVENSQEFVEARISKQSSALLYG